MDDCHSAKERCVSFRTQDQHVSSNSSRIVLNIRSNATDFRKFPYYLFSKHFELAILFIIRKVTFVITVQAIENNNVLQVFHAFNVHTNITN